MKEERNHHGALDKPFSEQQIRIVDANYIPCEKNETQTCSGTGSYVRQAGGRQAGGRQAGGRQAGGRQAGGRWQAGGR